MTSFTLYFGYLSFIKDPTNHVLLQCVVCVVKLYFWSSITNSNEVLNILNSKGFLASNLSTYDFSTLYTSFSHKLIKQTNIKLFEQNTNREYYPHFTCDEKRI